jgi:hypothetical protein
MGVPCQDAFAFQSLPLGVSFIAVADGLGSATRSDIGARLAVNIAVETALASLQNDNAKSPLTDIVKVAAGEARNGLASRASADGCLVRDLACTMIAVVLKPDEIAVAHVGDGGVVAQTERGLQLVSGPGSSEYANEVVPLTSDGWEQSLEVVHFVSSIGAVAVFTDGCQRAVFRKSREGSVPFEGFLNPIFDYISQLPDCPEAEQEISALLRSRKLCANSEDDKTLVVAVIRRN